MEYLRAGTRKNFGKGLPENEISGFVQAGGVGAMAGALAGCGVRRYFGLGDYTGPAVVVGGTMVGHMLGHEYYRQQADKRLTGDNFAAN